MDILTIKKIRLFNLKAKIALYRARHGELTPEIEQICREILESIKE